MEAKATLFFAACIAFPLVAFVGGCSTVRASAVRTGTTVLPPRTGPVAIYALEPPKHGRELGYVEVTAVGEEGSLESLLPVFVQRVAQLGGNAAFVEGVQARFDLVPRNNIDTYWYPCGFRACLGTRAWSVIDEVGTVKMLGRAYFVDGLGKTVPLGETVGGKP